VSYSSIARGLLLMATLLVLGYAFHALRPSEALDAAWMDHWARGAGLRGEALFLLVGALLAAVGLPRQVISFLAGYNFGAALGVALGVAATTLGAALTFWYARVLARRLVSEHLPRQVERLDAFVRDEPFLKTVAIRLLPVGNNMVTCLVAGVSRVSAGAFLSGSALGFLPQTVIFALAGSGVTVQPVLRIGVSAALFVASGALGIRWYRHLRRRAAGAPGQPNHVALPREAGAE
jgi:uncharacterized membrane protein YdjX (TVP38/TMEM64 family)